MYMEVLKFKNMRNGALKARENSPNKRNWL